MTGHKLIPRVFPSLARLAPGIITGLVLLIGNPGYLTAQAPVSLPFVEGFENDDWASRGWYDGPSLETSSSAAAPEGQRACIWRWYNSGDALPGGKGGRVLLEPCEGITFSFSIRYSEDWSWTGLGWHPHMFLFMTSRNGAFDGPAWTHLTVYVETVDGRLKFGIQDGQNIDTAHLRQDLTGISENRAVAGGNGSSDGYPDDLYQSGATWVNGKTWDSDSLYISEQRGPFYKGDWHRMKVHFQLNSIVDGKGINNGVFRWWMDGRLIMAYEDILFRTGASAGMKINQFLMLPYIGPGAKNPQSVCVDDIRIEREEEVLSMAAPAKYDFDGNGRPGLKDMLAFLIRARRDPTDSRLDRNGDGRCDVSDAFGLLVQLFGLHTRFYD